MRALMLNYKCSLSGLMGTHVPRISCPRGTLSPRIKQVSGGLMVLGQVVRGEGGGAHQRWTCHT